MTLITAHVWVCGCNPEAGCSSQPRVAVLGYPGIADRDWSQPQRGCGSDVQDDEHRNVAALCSWALGRNPVGVADSASASPRVAAEYSNPGLI